MKKELLVLISSVVLIFNASAQLPTPIAQYEFNGNLLNSVDTNDLLLREVTYDYSFSTGRTGQASDSSIAMNGNCGLISRHPINNQGWTKEAISYWFRSGTEGCVIQAAYAGYGSILDVQGSITGAAFIFDGTYTNGYAQSGTLNVDSTASWNHMFAQHYDGTTTIYVNGVLTTTYYEPMYTMSAANTLARYYIGMQNDNIYQLVGEIDDVRVYNDTLSPAQIMELYTGSSSTATVEENEIGFSVYPNPVKDVLVIKVTSPMQIELRDALGRVIFKENVSTTVSIPMETYSAGVYYLTNGSNSIQKVVKQ